MSEIESCRGSGHSRVLSLEHPPLLLSQMPGPPIFSPHFSLFCYYFPLGVNLLPNKFKSSLPVYGCFVIRMVEIGPVLLEKMISNVKSFKMDGRTTDTSYPPFSIDINITPSSPYIYQYSVVRKGVYRKDGEDL